MNLNVSCLYEIAQKPSRTIIGLMSGTSLDGLDIALCEFTGSGLNTSVKVSRFSTLAYSSEFKEQLKSVFARKVVDLEQVTLLNAFIGRYYADLISLAFEEWKMDLSTVDLIASHGQTIFHAPKHQHQISGMPNATLQIGDGDHIAMGTGIITLSDFRQKHIAAGGEGAPLAVYGDYLLFWNSSENRVMLNIGGIANLTFLPSDSSCGFLSSDVGPGNTLLDQFIQEKLPGVYYDKDAQMARSGSVSNALLEALMEHEFFLSAFPKTTGPELFSLGFLNDAMTRSAQTMLSAVDVMATLVEFSAQAIASAIGKILSSNSAFEVYLSGGGMYNPLLVSRIEALLNKTLKSTDDLGIHPDAKEAVLFALLANEAIVGNSQYIPGIPQVCMGKISFAK
jgi:anhydro-N-acetylmuramic acid kinase